MSSCLQPPRSPQEGSKIGILKQKLYLSYNYIFLFNPDRMQILCMHFLRSKPALSDWGSLRAWTKSEILTCIKLQFTCWTWLLCGASDYSYNICWICPITYWAFLESPKNRNSWSHWCSLGHVPLQLKIINTAAAWVWYYVVMAAPNQEPVSTLQQASRCFSTPTLQN